MRNIVLATEDELSEFLGEKLIKDANTSLNVTLRLRKGGFGYLKSKLPNLCGLSKTQPVIIFTDLDSCECPKEGANKQVISSQADSLIKISRIWADFFPANTSNQPI